MTPQDLDLATRTVLAEAGGTGIPGMVAVANVIKNRLAAGKFGPTYSAITTAKNQFEPMSHWGTGRDNDPARFDPNSPQYQLARRIVAGVTTGDIPDPTKGATHFYAPALQAADGRTAPAWAQGQTPTATIGGQMFYNLDGSENGPADTTTPGSAPAAPASPDPTQNPVLAAGLPSYAPQPQSGSPTTPGSGGGIPGGKVSGDPTTALMQGLFGKLLGGQNGGSMGAGMGAGGQQQQGGILGRMLFGNGGLQGLLGRIPTPNDGKGLFGGLFPQAPQLPGNPDGQSPQSAMAQASGLPNVNSFTPPADPPMPPMKPDDLGNVTPPVAAAATPGGGLGAGGSPLASLGSGGGLLSGLFHLFG